MFCRLRTYLKLKRQFKRIITDAVKMDGDKIEAIHVGKILGFVVDVGQHIEYRMGATGFYLKGTNIKVFPHSEKTTEYFIEWKSDEESREAAKC